VASPVSGASLPATPLTHPAADGGGEVQTPGPQVSPPVLQECYKSVARVLQERSKSVPRVLQELYKRVTIVLQGCHLVKCSGVRVRLSALLIIVIPHFASAKDDAIAHNSIIEVTVPCVRV
jgi:hypothetical protein